MSLGYVGALADWFDAEAIERLAASRPDWRVRLAGRVEDDRVRALGRLPNVELVGEIHEVRVRVADGGEIVNFHCRVDPARAVAAVHDKVDDVERALRQRFPSIRRAIGHAEPRL